MSRPQRGDQVSVHYTGKLADGSIFDTSVGEEPLVFTIGENDIIDGFEEGILGMCVGEKKIVRVEPEKAYGYPHEDRIIEIPLSEMPEGFEFTVGDELELTGEDEEPKLVIVTELKENSVILDGNPPLAGETLTFEIELLAIV